jgi:hypothetical protein
MQHKSSKPLLIKRAGFGFLMASTYFICEQTGFEEDSNHHHKFTWPTVLQPSVTNDVFALLLLNSQTIGVLIRAHLR